MPRSRWPLAPLGPCGPPWALVGPPGTLWAGPLWAEPLWAGLALVGRALVGPPGPLWAPLGACGPGPCGRPWALIGQALMGPPGIHIYIYMIYVYIYIYIYTKLRGDVAFFSYT